MVKPEFLSVNVLTVSAANKEGGGWPEFEEVGAWPVVPTEISLTLSWRGSYP